MHRRDVARDTDAYNVTDAVQSAGMAYGVISKVGDQDDELATEIVQIDAVLLDPRDASGDRGSDEV
jgi:hypothetical protein